MKRVMFAVLIFAVIGLVAVAIFYGVIPGLSMVETTTLHQEHGGIYSNGELIGPNSRKGFIMSHINDGFSQTIVCIGRACADLWAGGSMSHYRYLVYGRELIGDWVMLSKPGETSTYISNPNPGKIPISGMQIGGCKNLDDYSFEFVGTTYKAFRVVMQGFIDLSAINFFDDGHQWRTLQTDEATLFEGWGSITYPIIDGLPQSTFQIGREVKLGIKTHYGGDTSENGKPWKVIMRWPKDRGGEIYTEKSYADNVDTYFTFTVSEDMFSTSSDNSFEIEIYNTLVSKGELLVKTIDIEANAPSDVSLSGPVSIENGLTANVELKATVSPNTQLPIEYFQVSIFYGAIDTLMPDDPFSDRWILPTTKFYNVVQSGNDYKYTLSFVPDASGYEGFITVSAWAYDTEGRSSLHEKKWGINIWIHAIDGGSGEPPPETIEDYTGEHYGYGGHTEGWLPWEPSGGNWETIVNLSTIGLIIAVVIIAVFAVIAFLFPGKNPVIMAILIIVGLAIAIIQYIYFFM